MNEVIAVGVMVGVNVAVGETVGDGDRLGSNATGMLFACTGVGVK